MNVEKEVTEFTKENFIVLKEILAEKNTREISVNEVHSLTSHSMFLSNDTATENDLNMSCEYRNR